MAGDATSAAQLAADAASDAGFNASSRACHINSLCACSDAVTASGKDELEFARRRFVAGSIGLHCDFGSAAQSAPTKPNRYGWRWRTSWGGAGPVTAVLSRRRADQRRGETAWPPAHHLTLRKAVIFFSPCVRRWIADEKAASETDDGLYRKLAR